MKAGAVLAIMEGIIDGYFGKGAMDCVVNETVKGKSFDEIMLYLVERKRKKENEEKK